jgi:hypothetical protein
MADESDVAEPLISRHDTEQSTDENDDQSYPDYAESTSAPGSFVWKLTFAAALSGLLFGYEYVTTFSAFSNRANIK